MPSTSTLCKPAYRPVDHLKPRRVARNEQECARQRAEIKARHTKPRKDANPQWRIALLRMHDLENLCRASDVPDDGGWEYLTAAANHIAFIYRKADAKIAAIVAWCRRFTPSIPADRAKLLAERIIASPRMPSADKLAWRLGLTMATRTALGITTIGAVDMNKAERAALRKQKQAGADRARWAAKRTGNPRGRPSKGKPWLALGISRATYYRRETKFLMQHNLPVYAGRRISSHLPPQAIPDQDEGGFSFVPASPPPPSMLVEASS